MRRQALGDVVDVVAGQHIEASLYNSERVGSPYLTGPADFGETYPRVTKWTNSPKVFAKSSDVLVTVKGAGVGKSNLACDAAIGRQLMALRPRQGKILQSFLFHFIRFNERVIARLADGATVPGIGKADLADLQIHLPPLGEQTRIAAILDKADQLRQQRRQAIALLDSLTQSIFLEMFGDPVSNPKGWMVCRIGDLLDSANYGTSGKAGPDGRFPILRMGNITIDGRIDTSDLKYIDLSESEIPKYTVRRGDLLFNRTNSVDLVGKTAVFDLDDEYAFAGYLVRGRTNDRATPEYISAYLNSACGKALLRGMAKSIVGMANINAKEMQNIPIPAPPKTLQYEFSAKLEHVVEMRQKILPLVEDANSLFASLQHRAFSGQL